MNKIVRGKRYNTETADKIAQWDNGAQRGNTEFVEEILYRKRTGEYFLYGSGGPRSRYAEFLADGHWLGSEQIMPLTDEGARDWVNKCLDAAAYNDIFGREVEDKEAHVSYKLLESEIAKIKKAARAAGMTQTAFIKKWIEEQL